MTTNEKAIANLEDKDIFAKEENGTVYVYVGSSELELAIHEIEYQAKEYDMRNSDIEIFRCTLLIDGEKKYGYNIAVADLDAIETESHEIDDNIYFWCNGEEEFEDMVKNGYFDFQILDYEQIEYEDTL